MIRKKLNVSSEIEAHPNIPCIKCHIALYSFHVKYNWAFKRENHRCRTLVRGMGQEKKEHDARGL
jgi:hypothetical protein